jgi:hypothetical protein
MKYLKRFSHINLIRESKAEIMEGEDNAILLPENTEEVINQIFEQYFKNSDIIKGTEGSSKWTIVSRNHEDGYNMFLLGFDEDSSTRKLCIPRYISFKVDELPNIDLETEKKYLSIYFEERLLENQMTTYGNDKFVKDTVEKFKMLLRNWICKKMNFNPNDWKVYCVPDGNERIRGLANAMLGKGYTKSEDIKGEVVGKFN